MKHCKPYRGGSRVCFNYGQMGHLARDCTKMLIALINQVVQTLTPNKPLTGQGVGNGWDSKGRETMGSQAKVYALMCQGARTSNDVVTSSFLIGKFSS